MGCCQYHDYFTPDADGTGATSFTVTMPRITFGRGAFHDVGLRLHDRGLSRIAIITDAYLAGSSHMDTIRSSVQQAGITAAEFSEVKIEPSDQSVLDAANFLRSSHFDGVLAVGGGSVIDTAKAALAYACFPTDFTDYFAPPVGAGVAVPGPLPPIIACPTTGGTGSEATSVSVIRITDLNTKFVMQSRYFLPVEAIIDPSCAETLPTKVVASSGFDLLSHAIETYTARAYTRWPTVADPSQRLMLQGANPWSDLHAREALRLVGLYLERGVADAGDHEARDQLMWAATLAGMAFGNCGTHMPHAFSYAVSHLVTSFQVDGYPTDNGIFVPHGISVIVTSPAVFRFTASAAPERHLEAARCLGVDTSNAALDEAGEIVAQRIVQLMRSIDLPNGIGDLGFGAGDAPALAQSAARQARAINNAPRSCTPEDIEAIFCSSSELLVVASHFPVNYLLWNNALSIMDVEDGKNQSSGRHGMVCAVSLAAISRTGQMRSNRLNCHLLRAHRSGPAVEPT